jgi:uncharacterized protein with PIN domain
VTKIIGNFSIKRLSTGEVIEGQICDARKDQDISEHIFFTDIPLIIDMILAKKAEKNQYRAGTYDYEILSVSHPDLVKKKMQQIMLRHTETIHVVTSKSFASVTRHCPNCDIRDNELLEFIKAHIQKKSNPKKYAVIAGVLHCVNCDYYYVSKSYLRGLPRKIRNDLGVQLPDIKIDEHGRIARDDWRGSVDSILSRNGYTADGSLRFAERKEVIRYIINHNIGSFYDIQSHLTWLINTRSIRNPNAAEIWKTDLKWLQSEFGKGQSIRGILL